MYSTALLMPQYQCATLSVEAGMWRIVWYNWHPVKQALVRVRKTCGLNRVHDMDERRRLAGEQIKIINEALKNGWNYFTDAKGIQAPELLPPEKSTTKPLITITAALVQALRIRVMGKAGRTVSSYTSYLHTFTQFLVKNEMAATPAGQYTSELYYEYLFYKEGKGHGNKNTAKIMPILYV